MQSFEGVGHTAGNSDQSPMGRPLIIVLITEDLVETYELGVQQAETWDLKRGMVTK